MGAKTPALVIGADLSVSDRGCPSAPGMGHVCARAGWLVTSHALARHPPSATRRICADLSGGSQLVGYRGEPVLLRTPLVFGHVSPAVCYCPLVHQGGPLMSPGRQVESAR